MMGQVPDIGGAMNGPSKAEMQRLTAVQVVLALTGGAGTAPIVKLDEAPETAGTQLVDLAKKVAKYLDTGN